MKPPRYHSIDIAELTAAFSYSKEKGEILRDGNVAGSLNGQGRYRGIKYRGIHIPAHVLAWLLVTNAWPEGQVDHQDRNGTNNCWANLRLATPGQQQANRRLFKRNKSGFRGVYRHRCGKWIAAVRRDNKTHHLGYFDDPLEAAKAVEQDRLKTWGTFAAL